MPKQIREATAAPTAAAPGRLLVGLITPGWGSSGYYAPAVIENAAADKVWPKGTHVFFDHPGEAEMYDRPERSVRDLAAVLDEDARVENGGLVAEASVIGPYKDLVTDPVFVEAVGMSIRAAAETTTGEADGRKGTIITRLTEGISVDLVTRAGRGGKVLAVLESARATLREATADDTRDALQTAVRDAHPGEKTYSWVRDFDPDKGLVYFTVEDEQGSGMFQQSYELGSDGTASLTGDPVEVNVRTEYVPVTAPAAESGRTSVPAPAGQPENTPIPNVQEDTMGTIQVDEAEHGRLSEAAGRVPTLEAERDAAVQERDQLREANARTGRETAARTIIDARATEAGVTFTALETRGLLASLPVTEAGDLDEAAFTTAVDKDAATKAEEAGAGRVHGFGAATAGGEISESDARAVLYGEQKGA